MNRKEISSIYFNHNNKKKWLFIPQRKQPFMLNETVPREQKSNGPTRAAEDQSTSSHLNIQLHRFHGNTHKLDLNFEEARGGQRRDFEQDVLHLVGRKVLDFENDASLVQSQPGVLQGQFLFRVLSRFAEQDLVVDISEKETPVHLESFRICIATFAPRPCPKIRATVRLVWEEFEARSIIFT